jgi:amidase
LEKALPKEFLAPESLIPTDLYTAHFNATTIPERVLDVETLKITGLSATDIGKKISHREYTAVQVLTAFIKGATIAHQLTACALEILFDEGLERGKFLDDYLEKDGKLFNPNLIEKAS